jgi:hypothetical protein
MPFEGMGSLEVLDLSENLIIGSFFTSKLCGLNLRWLSIAANRIEGALPDSTSCLLRLTYLSLRDNLLSGTLDAVANLVALRHLDLGGNNFSVTAGWLQRLRMLTYLSLSSSLLTLSLLNGTAADSLLKLDLLLMLEIVVSDFSDGIVSMLCQLQMPPSTQLWTRSSAAKLGAAAAFNTALCRTQAHDPIPIRNVFVLASAASVGRPPPHLIRCCSIAAFIMLANSAR